MMLDRFFNKLCSENILKGLLILCGLVMLATMINREIKGDDCWFGEQSYWLAKEGSVKLKSIPLIFDWQNQFLVYHKLLIWMGSIIVSVFGWSVDYLRSFNLICFGLTLWVLWKITENQAKSLRLLVLFVMLFAPLSFEKSFEIRPEVPAMLFGTASFYFIKRYFDNQQLLSILLAGAFAGLSFLTHLNSVIYCLAGFFLLLFHKNIKATVLFSLAAVPVCFIYFIPLLDPENLQQWQYNIVNWPLHSFEDSVERNVFLSFIIRLLSEHKRFFWGDQIMGMSAMFFLILIFNGKYLWKNHKQIFLYTMLLALFLGLLGSHKSPRYIMLYQPFLAITIGYGLYSIKEKKNYVFKGAIVVVLLAQLAFTTISAARMLGRNEPHVEKHRNTLSSIPRQSLVLAPWELIYNEIDSYRIYNYKTFLYVQDLEDRKITQLDLWKECAALNIEYVVVTQEAADEYDLWFKKELKVVHNDYYEVLKTENDYLILKRKTSS
ncbi:MAG: glycosyltransferase family 39 protein [Fulvivirga sp.]